MAAIKKVNIIIFHTDLVNVVSELIELGCFEPAEPNVTLDPPDLTDMLHREDFELEPFEANYEKLPLLTTQYTYFVTGWLPDEYESTLSAMLSKYMCAWEVVMPTSAESEDAPTVMKFPQVLGKIRGGSRKAFVPLSKSNGS